MCIDQVSKGMLRGPLLGPDRVGCLLKEPYKIEFYHTAPSLRSVSSTVLTRGARTEHKANAGVEARQKQVTI
jgi:hypothetical protein